MSDPITKWNEEIVALIHKRGLTKTQAIRRLRREEPELYRAYLDAHTELHNRRLAQARRKPAAAIGEVL